MSWSSKLQYHVTCMILSSLDKQCRLESAGAIYSNALWYRWSLNTVSFADTVAVLITRRVLRIARNFIALRECVHLRICLPQSKRCTGSPKLVVTTPSLCQVCSGWAQRASITIVWLVCGILSLQHGENRRVWCIWCVEHLRPRPHSNPFQSAYLCAEIHLIFRK